MALMKLDTQTGYSILYLEGDFIGGEEINELRFKLKDFGENAPENNLIVDLKNVSYLNSTALGVFLSANAVFEKNNGKLLLCNSTAYLDNIFTITKLTLIFNLYKSIEEAVKSL